MATRATLAELFDDLRNASEAVGELAEENKRLRALAGAVRELVRLQQVTGDDCVVDYFAVAAQWQVVDDLLATLSLEGDESTDNENQKQ